MGDTDHVPRVLAERLEMVPVGDLIPWPTNPRNGDVDGIAGSIGELDFFGVILAQTSSKQVMKGNHTLLAARLKGMLEVPVVWHDVDDETARKIAVSDNRWSDLSSWDERGVLDWLDSFETLDGTGFDRLDVETMRKALDFDDDDPGDADGRAPAGEVKVQVGSYSFPVTRERFDAFEARIVGEVGRNHDAVVQAIMERLEI